MAYHPNTSKLTDKHTARSSISSYSDARPQMRNSFEKVLKKKSSVNFSILRGLMNSTPSNAKSLEQVKQNQNLKRSQTMCGLKTFVHYKKIAYVLLEQPGSSLLAKIIHTIIILATLISVFEGIFLIPKNIMDYLTPLFYIDSVIALIFALELTARILSITAFEGKSKKDLIKPILFVDIMGLIPIFAEIPVGDDGPLSAIVNKKVLNSLKTLLILKLLRYVKGAYIFANGVRKSLSSFIFLVMVIIIANFAFATSIYYVERSNPYSQLNEGIPIALWYTIVTMTTVGYGDVVPTTPAAKVITGLVAVFGMLVIALPVVILGYHFQEAFNEREEEQHIKRMKEYHLTLLQNLDKRKKETYFLQKRIENIEEYNKKVKEELEKSGTIYKRVSKDLRTLYRSIYADDKEDLDDIDGSMQRKVLLMEKLARTRKKIKLVTIFNRLNNGSRELTSPDYINSPTRSPKRGLQIRSRIFDENPDEINLTNNERSPRLTSLTDYMLQNKSSLSAGKVSDFNPKTSVMLQEKLAKKFKEDPKRARLKISPPQIVVECDLSEDEYSGDSLGINKVRNASSRSSMMSPSPSRLSKSPGSQPFHQNLDESGSRSKPGHQGRSLAVTTNWPSSSEMTAMTSILKYESSLQLVDKQHQSQSPLVVVDSPKRASLSPLCGYGNKRFIRVHINEESG